MSLSAYSDNKNPWHRHRLDINPTWASVFTQITKSLRSTSMWHEPHCLVRQQRPWDWQLIWHQSNLSFRAFSDNKYPRTTSIWHQSNVSLSVYSDNKNPRINIDPTRKYRINFWSSSFGGSLLSYQGSWLRRQCTESYFGNRHMINTRQIQCHQYKWSKEWSNLRAVWILGLRPANERRRYKVTPSLIGWAQT